MSAVPRVLPEHGKLHRRNGSPNVTSHRDTPHLCDQQIHTAPRNVHAADDVGLGVEREEARNGVSHQPLADTATVRPEGSATHPRARAWAKHLEAS